MHTIATVGCLHSKSSLFKKNIYIFHPKMLSSFAIFGAEVGLSYKEIFLKWQQFSMHAILLCYRMPLES